MKKKIIICSSLILLLCSCGDSGSNSAATIQSALSSAQTKGDRPLLGKSETVNGEDANNDGIRDDVKTYIDSLSDTPVQKKSLVQLAKAIQFSLTIDPTNKVSVGLATNKIFAASSCIQFSYSAPSLASSRNHDIEKYLINTKARLDAYSKFNVAASGGSYVLPAGEGCDEV